jgi:acyl-coenzyme A synthetase/AMP-(fatty) acid ligase
LVADEMKQLINARVAHLVKEFGDEPAALYGGASYSWTYVGKIQRILEEALAGVDGARPAAIVLRQRPHCLAATMAMWASGRCVSFISPIQADQALAEDLRETTPAVVIADIDDWSRPSFSDACATSIGVKLRLSVTEPATVHYPHPSAVSIGVTVPVDHAAIIATSGTTGPPKRYALTWDNLAPTRKVRDPSGGRGVMINTLPLFSIGGVLTMASTIFGGRPIALMDRFDVVEWASLIRDNQPRRAGAPPAVLRMVLDAEIPPEWFLSVTSLYTASAPLSPQLASEFEQVYKIPVIQGYGATEFLGGVTGWPGDLHEKWGVSKRGSVGRPLPGIKLRVVDSGSGEPLGYDEVGNLEVNSPYRAQGVPEGWVLTNDLARIDADGFVWILGRSDDVIIRGGFKVSLPDVEDALLQHPSVRDVCVVGLPDERVGEVPAALVVVDDSWSFAEDELIEVVRQQLPAYMAPAVVSRGDTMPLNSMMKKNRRLITSLLVAELQTRAKSS